MGKTVEHGLVPKHRLLTGKEKQDLMRRYGVKLNQLPKILAKDPVVKAMNAKPNDIIEITRSNTTAGETKYYRVVTP